MKVLNVLMENMLGGPQKRVLLVSKELKKYGIEPIILCPDDEGDFATKAKNEGLKVHQIPLKYPRYKLLKNIEWLFSFPLSILFIIKIIKKEKIDIVHCNGLLCLQAPIAAVLSGKKIVWHLIGSMYPQFIIFLLKPFITRVSHKIIFIAETLSKYYLGKDYSTYKNYKIIYECVDNRFNPNNVSEEEKNNIRYDLGINPHEKIIGCIGNVNPTKGQIYLIKSLIHLKKEIKNFKLLIVGNIPESQFGYLEEIKKVISENDLNKQIIFTGARDDIPLIMSILDILVVPSLNEGTPLVILEAMAMELPFVATDVGAIKEITFGNNCIVKPKKPKIISKAIINTLKIDNSLERKKIRKIVKQKFSIEKCSMEHKDVYESIMYDKKRN